MLYKYAKKLHNEDEVFDKETKRHLKVVQIKVDPYDVYVLCNDGEWYHHRRLA